jgi:hypothetical protein
MTWTCYVGDTECGACRVCIVSGDPVALFAGGRCARCVSCAGLMGFEVDWAQVDDAKFEIERRAWASTSIASTSTPSRLPPVRQPQPLSAIADRFFDPKAAAAGDRD